MKHIFLIILILSTSLFAEKTVTKTITVNQMLYPKKTLAQLEAIAVEKAKFAAAKEIFGEFLLSETVMTNGKVLDDIVREKSGGVIHVRGEPKFKNGENFGDLEVTIVAYATDEEIKDMSPAFINVTNFKYSNPDIAIRDLKAAAEDAFIIEAISRKKPSIRDASASEARKLALSITITKFDYDKRSSTYTMSGKVEYIPAFLRHANVISNKTIGEAVKDIRTGQRETQNSQEKIKQTRRGFYGIWSGFFMRSNGGSGDATIEITDSGLATINYNSSNCGGELIIQEKSPLLVKFEEKLNFGQDHCQDGHLVVLKKVDNSQIKFLLYNKEKGIAKGTLYRDE